jgi:hypothetical protein
MNWFFIICSYFIVGLISVTIKKHISFFNYFPDLLLITMLFYCFFKKKFFNQNMEGLYGLLHGIIAGFFSACFSINQISFSIFAYMTAGFLAEKASGIVKVEDNFHWIVVFIISLIFYVILGSFSFILYKNLPYNYIITVMYICVLNTIVYSLFEPFLKRKL